MEKLEERELEDIKGGFGFWTAAGLIGFGIFIIGVFDGITRPLKCR